MLRRIAVSGRSQVPPALIQASSRRSSEERALRGVLPRPSCDMRSHCWKYQRNDSSAQSSRFRCCPATVGSAESSGGSG